MLAHWRKIPYLIAGGLMYVPKKTARELKEPEREKQNL